MYTKGGTAGKGGRKGRGRWRGEGGTKECVDVGPESPSSSSVAPSTGSQVRTLKCVARPADRREAAPGGREEDRRTGHLESQTQGVSNSGWQRRLVSKREEDAQILSVAER